MKASVLFGFCAFDATYPLGGAVAEITERDAASPHILSFTEKVNRSRVTSFCFFSAVSVFSVANCFF